MATKTWWVLATGVGLAATPNWWSILQEDGSAPTGANCPYGWKVAKIDPAVTPFWQQRLGCSTANAAVAQATSYNVSTSGPNPGTADSGTACGDCFATPNAYTGTFANTAWTFDWNMRTATTTTTGRINMRVWASTNANGSSPRELTASNLNGATITMNSSSADFDSSISWSPGAITLTNEFLFFQTEWEETVAGTANQCQTVFRAGTAKITSPDFTAGSANVLMGANLLFM